MFVIGLTGGLSTGKSSVAKIFKAKGCLIIDADRIAHNLLTKKQEIIKEAIKRFGKQILSKGGINRKALARIVFSSQKKLTILEKIIHPAVRKEIGIKLKQYRKTKRTLVLDVPLLFEAGLYRFTDINIVVCANKKTQIQRAIKRLHITKKEALNRINKQMPLSQKIRRADIIIDNNGTRKQMKVQVEKICQRINQMKKSQGK